MRARPAPQEVSAEACEAHVVSEYLSHPCGVPGSTQTARGCIPLSGVFVPDLVLSCGHRRFSGCAAVGEPDCSGADLPQNLPIPDQRGVAEREGSYWGRKCCTLRPRAGPAETRHPDVFLCQRVLTVSAAAAHQPTPAAECPPQWPPTSPRLPLSARRSGLHSSRGPRSRPRAALRLLD